MTDDTAAPAGGEDEALARVAHDAYFDDGLMTWEESGARARSRWIPVARAVVAASDARRATRAEGLVGADALAGDGGLRHAIALALVYHPASEALGVEVARGLIERIAAAVAPLMAPPLVARAEAGVAATLAVVARWGEATVDHETGAASRRGDPPTEWARVEAAIRALAAGGRFGEPGALRARCERLRRAYLGNRGMLSLYLHRWPDDLSVVSAIRAEYRAADGDITVEDTAADLADDLAPAGGAEGAADG